MMPVLSCCYIYTSPPKYVFLCALMWLVTIITIPIERNHSLLGQHHEILMLVMIKIVAMIQQRRHGHFK